MATAVRKQARHHFGAPSPLPLLDSYKVTCVFNRMRFSSVHYLR